MISLSRNIFEFFFHFEFVVKLKFENVAHLQHF